MHELSVAISLIDVITESLIRDGSADARVKSVTVEVGTLGSVVPEALRTAFATAIAGTDLHGCALHLVPIDVRLRCSHCGDVPAIDANDLRCVRCLAPSNEVIRGRELDVVAIELDEETS